MKLNYSGSFKKDFKKLSKKLQDQFKNRVEIFKINQFNPLLNNHSLHHPYEGCRSINISGDFRALYEISGDIITFVRISTHSELFK